MTTSPTTFSFDRLPAFQPRRFVPQDADLTRADQITALYDKLLARTVSSKNELAEWLLDRSELEAAVDQAGDIIYIKMTCQTDNKEYADAYKAFIEDVAPAVKPLDDRLNQKYLELREQFPPDPIRFKVYDRELIIERELFREENIPLATEINLLSQEYQTVCGAMTVEFQGRTHTLPEMAKYLQEPDRSLRESAWRASAERRLRERDKLDGLFENMLKLRNTVAKNAGFSSFTDYQFKAYHRFDYTPLDCRKYHEAIEKLVVPVLAKIRARRKKEMKLDALRPWDQEVDPAGRPALKPFSSIKELIDGCRSVFKAVHPDFGGGFEAMAADGLLDLASRPGKAPGGYQNTLDEARRPFIFMNSVGLDSDVMTLLHEGGHAFHALACAGDPLVDYRHAPMEFSEVASMSMELLGSPHLSVFYNDEEQKRSWQHLLEGIVWVLAWVATVDAFQQWIYAHPGHTREERVREWVAIHDRFGGAHLDWSGLDDIKASLWHRQLHIFEVPFYYIEYGIAQLGALQIWLNSLRDKTKAVADYRKSLTLGGSRPLPELFAAAGLKFDFSERTIAPLVAAVEKELGL